MLLDRVRPLYRLSCTKEAFDLVIPSEVKLLIVVANEYQLLAMALH